MQLTPVIVRRVSAKQTALSDPCVICGVQFKDCPHDINDTAAVIKQVAGLSRADRAHIMETK